MLLLAMVLTFTLIPDNAHAAAKEPGSAPCMSPAKVKLKEDMRRLLD